MDTRSDAELLRAAHADPTAFGVLYRRHVPALLAFCVRRTGPEAGTDIASETFATALERAPTFDPVRGEAIGWLYGIAAKLIAMYHRTGRIERRAQRRLGLVRPPLDDEELERIERLASLDVSADVLAGALADLPSEQREAVVSRIVHEHTYDEMSRTLDVSPAVARKRVSRGLAALRHRLGGQR